jgi:hypothetical protein
MISLQGLDIGAESPFEIAVSIIGECRFYLPDMRLSGILSPLKKWGEIWRLL